MIPYDYQIKLADKAKSILHGNKLVYIAMEERTGKTLIALLATENEIQHKNVLIITKLKAIEGWKHTIDSTKSLHNTYTIINYHSCHKIDENLFTIDIIILDEAHNYISGYPTKSSVWKKIYTLSKNKEILYLSATPCAQGEQLLYHQFALSTYSPWYKYKSFYTWYHEYALRNKKNETDTIWVHGRKILTYKKVNRNKIWQEINHLFITKTRKELGFLCEPQDYVHYIELDAHTKKQYNMLLQDKILTVDNKTLIADSILKLRLNLHMLEGGVLKIEDDYLQLINSEKINYILQTWQDTADLVIMYYYVAEAVKLKTIFKNASILHSSTYAEGVDLSDKKHLVIYSQDFSTSKYIQRRARQANINRVKDINVHFLLVKKAISEQVYITVSKNKQNYTDSLFKEIKI